MLRILVVEKEEDLRDVVGFYLESEMGAKVDFAASVAEATKILDVPSDIGCVVCDYSLDDGTAEDVIKHARTGEQSTPFILYGAYHPNKYPTFLAHPVDGFVSKWELFDKLKTTIEHVLSEIKGKREETELPDYCRIRTKTILKLGVLNCDFYLKLPQNRYVRVLREGDMFETEDFNRFNEKAVEHLYIKSKDRSVFLEKLAQDLLQLSMLKSTPAEAVFQISTSTLEVIAELLQRFGFSEEVEAVAKANVTLAVKNIQNNTDLGPLFNLFMLDMDAYLPSHSVVMAYACCGIASLMGWKSDMTFYKLTLASFMHDILLKNQELAQIQTLPELDRQMSKFTQQEIKEFLAHPVMCSQLLRNVKDIPLDVDVIILQHHERPDGKGFPGNLNYMKISPLSAVFILAHEILHFYKNHPARATEPSGVSGFISSLSPEYNKGYFKSLVHAMSESVKKRS
jgi:HD-GYP domain-containing protein (c-di-GMP phosphodiesterase class II)/CheY-like chemotaxis protein